MADGRVFTWGRNDSGQIGDGTIATRLGPTQVPGISSATQVAAGDWHALALLADGTVVAWGYNSDGQLGDGTTADRSTPVPVHGLANVKAIAAAGLHSPRPHRGRLGLRMG